MCGIVGKVTADGSPVDPAMLRRMCAALRHRGPDAQGTHVSEGAGLGIQRLRIIDLEGGDQPIYNEDGNVVVVLNGEIYNFRELRRRLERSGHSFATRSDTEVIVHLYEERGPACVRELHGMFALAIWDRRRRRLMLARDRVGKKPLFFSLRDGELSFASELDALLEDPEVPRDLDHAALDAYLAFRCVPAPRSALRAVRKLPPASTLVLSGGRAEIETYWRLDYARKTPVADVRDVAEALREQLRRAVRRRLVADVPLGAFLSGGIDSAAVVATMAELSAQPVRTFTIGFRSAAYDELPLARRVAQRFATEHHELVVEPDALRLVPEVLRRYGEPFADSSALPSYLVAQMARPHVTVALNGDGGDENFAGYTRYAGQAMLGLLDGVPRPVRAVLAEAGRRVAPGAELDGLRSRVRRLAEGVALDPGARYARYLSALSGLDRDALYTPEHRELAGEPLLPAAIEARWNASSATSLVDRMLDVDVQTYLADDLLVKMDIATMAHSLEARSPLLDHELMEFAASLPAEMKLHRRETKVALRAALRGLVPDEVLDAPKRGFRLPIADWFRGELAGYARDVLLDPATLARGWFRPAYVCALLDRHEQRLEDRSQAIWTLLALELWQREVVDGPPAALSASPPSAAPQVSTEPKAA
jgi:asparagine synthase (glutamine-hydrolysing)